MTGRPPPAEAGRRLTAALAVVVAGAALAAFLPALDGGFVDWDDDRNFLDNPGYRGLGPAQLRWMVTATWMGHYIPLTWWSLGLNYALGGMNPRGYHLGNLLLHAINAVLFFLVARRLLGGSRDRAVLLGAAAAALLFGLHPLRAESVAWITERRDVLCGAFYLLAVLAYLRGVERGHLEGRWQALSLGAFAAALLSKGMAMTLPLTLLLLDAYPLRRSDLGWRALLREKAPYAGLALAGAALAAWAVSRGAAWTPYEAYGPGARAAMTAYSLWFYPWKLAWPVGLSPLYELPARLHWSDWRFLGPALAVLLVTAILVLLRRRVPGALAAWIHSAIVLAPVSGIAHAGYQLTHDRYSYLSGLGFAVVAGAGVTWLARERARARVSRWVFAVSMVGVTAALVGLAVESNGQSRIWRDSETLWRAAVEADARCMLCRSKLGLALIARGELREAEIHLRQAVALRPDRFTARNALGTLLVRQERYAEAEAELQEALRLAPRSADVTANLGALRARQGRNAEAIVLLRDAVERAPWLGYARENLARALHNSGVRLARDGQPGEAIPLFTEAAALLPEDPDLWRNLGQALVEQRRGDEAAVALERAVRLRPRGAPERFWLARAYLLTGQPGEAEREIAALRELDPAAAGRLSVERR
jgi:Flp pilus assembly protein TadD